VTESIAPAELAHLSGHGVLGVAATSGSAYSHSAILARSMRLPMLVGVAGALTDLHDGDLVLIDAERGEAIVHPAAQDLTRYRNWQRDSAREGKRLARLARAPTQTADGCELRLYVNAELPAQITQARALGTSGIGLYRTEFLFLKRDRLPDEEEQFCAYRDAVLGMGGLPVTIRTLDLGADKADGTGLTLVAEPNPALGVRGVRLSLRQPAIFAMQLRAILRAACYGPVRILVPMVTDVGELAAVRTLIEHCARDLRTEGHEIPDQFELGAMVEVPAAAIGVRALLSVSDFLAIGTNDLAQYVLAADRNNDSLGQLYDPLHPALLRLIARVIRAGNCAGKPVSLCGEIGGDPRFASLLVALGLTDFSMHPGRILNMRDALAHCNRNALRALAPKLLQAKSREEVAELLNRKAG